MPFESDRQRRFMFAKHPRIARRWTREAKKKGEPVTKGMFKANSKRYLKAIRSAASTPSSGRSVLDQTLSAREKALLEAKAKKLEKSADLVDIGKAFGFKGGPLLSRHGVRRVGAAQHGGARYEYQHSPGLLGRARGETSHTAPLLSSDPMMAPQADKLVGDYSKLIGRSQRNAAKGRKKLVVQPPVQPQKTYGPNSNPWD